MKCMKAPIADPFLIEMQRQGMGGMLKLNYYRLLIQKCSCGYIPPKQAWSVCECNQAYISPVLLKYQYE